MEIESKDLNLILIGDGYVGKTSILKALKNEKFEELLSPNIQDEIEIKKQVDSISLNLKIIDTAGQEEYDILRKMRYEKANFFLVCFCVTEKTSYDNVLHKWIPEIQKYRTARAVPLILIGTKKDLREESKDKHNMISRQLGIKLQKKIGAYTYLECSAKTREGIDDILDQVVNVIKSSKNKRGCNLQ